MVKVETDAPALVEQCRTQVARLQADMLSHPRNSMHRYGEVRYAMGFISALHEQNLLSKEAFNQLRREIDDVVAKHF